MVSICLIGTLFYLLKYDSFATRVNEIVYQETAGTGDFALYKSPIHPKRLVYYYTDVFTKNCLEAVESTRTWDLEYLELVVYPTYCFLDQ